MVSEGLNAALQACDTHDWQRAYDLAHAAGGDDAQRLDVLAEAAWWLGRLDECIAAREEAYQRYLVEGSGRAAGRCAVSLYETHCLRARPAMGSGWLSRARRALEDDTECHEYGALLLREAERGHGSGELEHAGELAREAMQLARRVGSADLEAEALQTLGRVLISQGSTSLGMAHLDEAMLFAIEGRLGPYSTGKVYCSLIGACEELGDLRRAAEWTDATMRWAEQHPFAIFPGICRVHRAAALEWRGEYAEAVREAERACVELLGSHLPNAAAAHAEVGDIKRRLGDLEGAELAFARAEELAGAAFPAVALLRLAQGRVDEALRINTDALAGATWNRPARARLLADRAQIAIASSDLAGAAEATTELEALAAVLGSPPLIAEALTAQARLQLARGEPAAARISSGAALARWEELGVPYQAATVLSIQARALAELGEHDAAAGSTRASEERFAALGVRANVTTPARAEFPAGLTEREVEVLRQLAAGLTNNDIAAALHLSPKTVSRHLSSIFTKAGVSTRSAATAFAYASRLVEAPARKGEAPT